jgi:mannose-6-phosphate isomerase-like protein (cupin superfamily)
MTETPAFDFVRQVDAERFAALGPDERLSQKLLDLTSGAAAATVAYIQTPPGGGSPRGMHTHAVEQLFFVLSGTMRIEIEGVGERTVEPGGLIIFPAGVPHRNWNDGEQPTVHLAINAPALPPGEQAMTPASKGAN